jgi:hypothetical protein
MTLKYRPMKTDKPLRHDVIEEPGWVGPLGEVDLSFQRLPSNGAVPHLTGANGDIDQIALIPVIYLGTSKTDIDPALTQIGVRKIQAIKYETAIKMDGYERMVQVHVGGTDNRGRSGKLKYMDNSLSEQQAS